MTDFSLCVPTWNRADLLADTLARLPDGDYEIVVSDNASIDHTADVLNTAAKVDPRIRITGLTENKGTFVNTRRAFEQASTDIVIYMPDDDSILLDPLLEHVARMKAEPDLTAVFTDSIAWDDEHGVEMHRYYPQGMSPQVFSPDDNVQIADFLLKTFIPPEIGVFRKDAALKARIPVAKAQPYHIWAYNFSRLGRIRFDPLAFLREHRALKPQFTRTHWGNMDEAWSYVGDAQRLGLSIMYQMALRDQNSPAALMNDLRRLKVHDMIEAMLCARVTLEIGRALERGDFILGRELRAWQMLWNTAGDKEADYRFLTVPAAGQAAELCGVEAETMVEAYRI